MRYNRAAIPGHERPDPPEMWCGVIEVSREGEAAGIGKRNTKLENASCMGALEKRESLGNPPRKSGWVA